MKPAPFAYVRPATLADAVGELAAGERAGGAKVLAGGQSLMPVLAMRLGRPGTLVDITALPELQGLTLSGAALRIGAAVRQRRVERDRAAVAAVPLLAVALPFVGHRELRSRGTVCGSLAHADPAAELPALTCCLDGVCELTGPAGARRVPAAEFFTGAMTTAAAPEEILTAVELPVTGPGEGYGFAEVARRHGDFALAGVVTRVRVDAAGELREARLTAFGVSDRPVTRDVTAVLREALGGAPGELEHRLRPRTAALATEVVDTAGDGHGSTGYRRRLLGVLAARELAAAWRRAREERR